MFPKRKRDIRILMIGFCCCLGASTGQAQLYTDYSDNLPDDGAKGQSMDVRAIDVDGDGDLDILLANEFQANTLLFNDGQGRFTKADTDHVPQAVHDSEDVAPADYNGDGHVDLVFCSEDDVTLGWTNVHEYYVGLGDGRFQTASFQLPDSEANAVISIDINQDDHPDLLFGNDGPITALINAGDGSFTDESGDRFPSLQRTTQDLHSGDVDGDGDLDIFEANEDGNVIYINNGSGFFTDESSDRLPQRTDLESRKASMGDVDGDGDLDIFLSNVAFRSGRNPQNRLCVNDGLGVFSDETATRLPADSDHTIDAIFEDVDIDGDLDVVAANVFGGPMRVYTNDATGFFLDATDVVFGQTYIRDALGVIAADLNADGLRDIYVCDRNTGTDRKDLLLIRNRVTSVEESASTGLVSLRIYPNPIRREARLITSARTVEAIRLRTLHGALVGDIAVDRIADGHYRIDVPAQTITSGTYLLEVQTSSGTKTQKIFVE